MKVLIAHYSLLGHTHRLAEAIAEGAKEIEGAKVMLMRVSEILTEEEIKRRGAYNFQKSFEKISVCTLDEVAAADAIFLGAPTYLGNMCSQMQHFLNSLPRSTAGRSSLFLAYTPLCFT